MVLAVHELLGVCRVLLSRLQALPSWPNEHRVPNMFTMLRSTDHSRRKRQLSNIYAKSYLQRTPSMQAIVQEVIKRRFLGLIDTAAQAHQNVEIYGLLSRMAMDVMSAYMFGLESGTNMLDDTASFERLMKVYVERGKHAFVVQEMPSLLGAAKSFALPPYTSQVEEARNKVDQFCIDLCKRAEARIDSGKIEGDEAVVFRQLTKYDGARAENNVGGRDDGTSKTVASELLDHFRILHPFLRRSLLILGSCRIRNNSNCSYVCPLPALYSKRYPR